MSDDTFTLETLNAIMRELEKSPRIEPLRCEGCGQSYYVRITEAGKERWALPTDGTLICTECTGRVGGKTPLLT